MFAFVVIVFLIFGGQSTQGLTCYDCNIAEDPNCLQRNPPNQVECQRTDVGCGIYDSSSRAFSSSSKPNPPYQIGSKRCICQSELDCFAEQGILLEQGVCVEALYSWGQHETCLTEGFPSSSPTQLDQKQKVRSKICLCKGDRCNSKGAQERFQSVEFISNDEIGAGDRNMYGRSGGEKSSSKPGGSSSSGIEINKIMHRGGNFYTYGVVILCALVSQQSLLFL